jgi:hypothetical protein
VQVSLLTDRAREIYRQMQAEKKTGVIMPNLQGFVFTLFDGTRVTKGRIHAQVKKSSNKRASQEIQVSGLSNTARTEWAEIAMKVSGHSSVQMHQRYVDLQAADVANAFGTSQIDTRIDTQKRGVSRK